MNMPTTMTETQNKANGATHALKGALADGQFEKLSHEAGKQVGAMAADIATASSEFVTAGRDYVKENPVKGVAVAAAAGAVVGALATMVFKRK